MLSITWPFGCTKPKLQNNLKANHNGANMVVIGEVVVPNLSYRII